MKKKEKVELIAIEYEHISCHSVLCFVFDGFGFCVWNGFSVFHLSHDVVCDFGDFFVGTLVLFLLKNILINSLKLTPICSHCCSSTW